MTALLTIAGVSKRFRGLVAVDRVACEVQQGEIFAVIGPNGAGKSTMMKMIMGKETPDSGEVKLGHTVKLAYVDQSRDALDPKLASRR